MQNKHEVDILAEQIKKGKFKGKVLRIKISKKNTIESAFVEDKINLEDIKKIAE